jgi:hypothetical protein
MGAGVMKYQIRPQAPGHKVSGLGRYFIRKAALDMNRSERLQAIHDIFNR